MLRSFGYCSSTCSVHLLVHCAPHCLLRGEGEGNVDPVQRHPVNVLLPLLPFPEGIGVAGGADVLVIAEPVIGMQGEGGRGKAGEGGHVLNYISIHVSSGESAD
jgi:hypothetical protein